MSVSQDVEMAVDPTLDKLLLRAIENKRLLRFRYKGSERIAEPHDYGIDNGMARLLCWQVGGRSNGRVPGWRLINVGEMQNCEMIERRFSGNRDVPSGKHHQWERVFIRVEPPDKLG